VVALSGRRQAASTRADARGRFEMTLPAGRYLIRATNVGGYRSTAEQAVTVSASDPATVTLIVDTGIR